MTSLFGVVAAGVIGVFFLSAVAMSVLLLFTDWLEKRL